MAKKSSRSRRPTKLIIRSYQVGFGDCFLLTFRYSAAGGKPADRHVLIDCGSTGRPKNAPTLKQIATQIQADCAGKLTAVVATHRHADHINGFATNAAGTASGDILRDLQPDVVLQPWTEHPKAAKTAAELTSAQRRSARAVNEALFVGGLQSMHRVAEAVLVESRRIGRHWPKSLQEQLAFLGEENLHNLSAVKNLMAMGKKGAAEYLSYGDKTSLGRKLPGVKIHVLGPPTPAQYPEVAKQRHKDASEFWHILGISARSLGSRRLNPFPNAEACAGDALPASSRWLAGRIRAIHGSQRLAIVRALDDAMNNTSLILLFEVAGKLFLFPGDAQIENWNFALKDAPDAENNCRLLAATDFYKVGHHGSLNATPKTLWRLFKKRGKATRRNRLGAVVSTMAGKHGSPSAKTEVPRRTLLNALGDETNLVNTQTLRKQTDFSHVIEFDL
jgi:hypothetical protein